MTIKQTFFLVMLFYIVGMFSGMAIRDTKLQLSEARSAGYLLRN